MFHSCLVHRGRTVHCAHTVRKVGCFPPWVATGPRVLNSAPYSPCWYTRDFFLQSDARHGPQGPEFCTPCCFELIMHASVGGWFPGCSRVKQSNNKCCAHAVRKRPHRRCGQPDQWSVCLGVRPGTRGRCPFRRARGASHQQCLKQQGYPVCAPRAPSKDAMYMQRCPGKGKNENGESGRDLR